MNPQDLAAIYDRHAPAVYGVGLALTRIPRDARHVLTQTFLKVLRDPGFPEEKDQALRLLKEALPIAAERRKRMHLWRKRRSSAFDASTPKEIRADFDRMSDADFERAVLSSQDWKWRGLPRSIRSPILLKLGDALIPGHRKRRWLLLWGLVGAALLFAAATELFSPSLPEPRVGRPQ